ncbi:MAG TPA: hypothetical protein VMA54_23880 [Steroidobacteraceae bacterium]|nr:hypothetical protein [Steroidobacteraceae bacterium]
MRLIRKSTAQRNLAQIRLGLQHASCGKLQPAPDHEGVRRLAERKPEGAREVRLAALHQHAEVGDEQAMSQVSIDVFAHLAHLPRQQSPSSIRHLRPRFGIDLLLQQRRRLKEGAMCRRRTLAQVGNG